MPCDLVRQFRALHFRGIVLFVLLFATVFGLMGMLILTSDRLTLKLIVSGIFPMYQYVSKSVHSFSKCDVTNVRTNGRTRRERSAPLAILTWRRHNKIIARGPVIAVIVQDKVCCRLRSFHRLECHPKSCRARNRSRASTTWRIWRRIRATTSWPFAGETKTCMDLRTSSASRRSWTHCLPPESTGDNFSSHFTSFCLGLTSFCQGYSHSGGMRYV